VSLRLAAVGAMLLAAAGCAIDPDLEPATARQALVGGEATAGDPAIVALLDAHGGLACTGVLVAADAVVTAAHCLVDTPRPRVFFGAEVGGTGQIVDAVGHTIDPAYRVGEVGSDLGLLVLAEPSSVAPLPLASPPAAGTPVRLVGFGADGATDYESAGRKRTGGAHLEAVVADHVRVVPDPAQPCGGDSGAPALAIVDGAEQVVGIVSRGDPDCAAFALLARADRAWRLGDEVAAGVVTGGCAAGGGSGATGATLALVLVLARRRRRRANTLDARARPAHCSRR
jgi:hypothetical protein